MFEHFEAYIKSHVDLPAEELKYMRSLAMEKKLRRRQLLLKEGEVCRHKVFVVKGLLRSYQLREDGTEHIMRFAPENTWMIDHGSYVNQTPSKYNIEALEDAAVILWSRDDFEELMAASPTIKAFSEKVKETSFEAIQERILVNISYTVEEKYENFITSFPEVFGRVPLHMIASYLGVSRETLTRVRQGRLKHLKHNS